MSTYLQIERYLMRWSAPEKCYQLCSILQPLAWTVFLMTFVLGLFAGLFLVPADYQQQDGFRIIYLHVPAAFLSLFIYVFMASFALVGLVWRVKSAYVVMHASLFLGALFTLLTLITGSIWAKPMWGTWWIWDARLTSELVLLFIYLGLIGLRDAIPNQSRQDKAVAVLCLIGIINIPIIHYSVEWWFTLHQGATLLTWTGPKIHVSMRYPLYIMILSFYAYYVAMLCKQVQSELLYRYQNAQWAQEKVTNVE